MLTEWKFIEIPKKTPNPKQSLKITRLILQFSKIIASISPKLSILFAAKLISTPIKHKIPKRELEMYRKSIQKLFEIQSINKKVMVNQYDESQKKILRPGRGMHLFKIADDLLKKFILQ